MFNDYFPIIMLVILVPLIVITLIVVGVVALFNHNRNRNNMDPNQTNEIRPKETAKDVLLNLGAFIGLYTLVVSLLSLLFTVINVAYPQITSGYVYSLGSQSISWPVSTLIVFFPVFILLMWFLEREYKTEPERKNSLTHRGLTYITLFVAGLTIVGDLITVVYYFIDGQELTPGFLLKVLVLLVIASGLFIYFISDLRGKLTARSRVIWRFISGLIILASIAWGFSVLGSPRTQQLIKYDEQKVNDLTSINSAVQNDYYNNKSVLLGTLTDLSNSNSGYSYFKFNDGQTGKPYEYNKTGDLSYELCAVFNKDSKDNKISTNTDAVYNPPIYGTSWNHPAGHYCFKETVTQNAYNNYNSNTYPKSVPVPIPVI